MSPVQWLFNGSDCSLPYKHLVCAIMNEFDFLSQVLHVYILIQTCPQPWLCRTMRPWNYVHDEVARWHCLAGSDFLWYVKYIVISSTTQMTLRVCYPAPCCQLSRRPQASHTHTLVHLCVYASWLYPRLFWLSGWVIAGDKNPKEITASLLTLSAENRLSRFGVVLSALIMDNQSNEWS